MERQTGAARDLFRKYIVANLLILALPALVAIVFYVFSARTIRDDVDELAANQLGASLATIDRQLLDIQKVAAQFAIDYEVNFYLNNPGPFSPVETYNLKRISDKLSTFVLGNDLLGHCFLYFAQPGMIAYENGFSDFPSFYGPVFTAEGYDLATFSAAMLGGLKDETIYTRMRTSFSGLKSESHLAVRPIGYGVNNRGSLVGVIEGRNLERLLVGLPQKYGGWVAIYDAEGNLIATTDSEAERMAARVRDPAKGGRWSGARPGSIGTVRIDSGIYRSYVAHSFVTGWDYVAALDAKKILADTRAVRDAALLILGVGFLGACAVSYWFAYSHSRPLGRMFSLLMPDQRREDESAMSIYEKAEKAIAGLSDSRSRLETELEEAQGILRVDLFRRLLDGAYPDRLGFRREAQSLGVELDGGARRVLLSRIRVPGDSSGLRAPSPIAGFPRAQCEGPLAPGEYAVPLSPGETAYILLDAGDSRAVAMAFAASVVSATAPELRDSLLFGAGDPVKDAFLLHLSFAQAEAALRRPAQSASIRFYADLPVPAAGFFYPLDVEESLMKSVRSANRELFDSLFESLLRDNFDERALAPREARDFASALRSTALRLLPDYAADSAAFRERLYRGPDPSLGPAPLSSMREVFGDMITSGETQKRSHNSGLSARAREFIAARLADQGLGLALVARELGISENYLSNLYKEQTGECISETIESSRIAAAKKLLSEGVLAVDLVAQRTGYQVSNFRRAFKRVTGMAPSDYRGRYGSGDDARGKT